jgi:hypothetical protein
MIAVVSLRLLYLIFQQVLDLIRLLGRRASSKAWVPETRLRCADLMLLEHPQSRQLINEAML